jgi:hypothetical protein
MAGSRNAMQNNVSMIHAKLAPVESYALLNKEKKDWLIRESREEGMVTLDYRLTDEMQRVLSSQVEVLSEAAEKLKKKGILLSKREAQQVPIYRQLILDYQKKLEVGFGSRRYAVVDLAWCVVGGNAINEKKAVMTPFNRLKQEEKEKYVESLFKLLNDEKFEPKTMREPTPSEASQREEFQSASLVNFSASLLVPGGPRPGVVNSI